MILGGLLRGEVEQLAGGAGLRGAPDEGVLGRGKTGGGVEGGFVGRGGDEVQRAVAILDVDEAAHPELVAAEEAAQRRRGRSRGRGRARWRLLLLPGDDEVE